MKKHPIVCPVIAVAGACLLPFAAHGQPAASQPSQPSTPSMPSTPTLPSTPSQPAGIPYPSSLAFPGAAFQPAGTQGSNVTEEVAPGLQLRAMAGVERESNVLRRPGGSVDDAALILGVGLRADRRFGLQRLRADLEANTYRYGKESSLDYHVFNYALAWDWAITPRFHGVAAADQKQYRDVTLDPVLPVNRVGRRTERTQLLEGVYEAGAALRLTGAVSHTESRSTLPATWDASPEVTSARVGAGYAFASGGSVYARFRRGEGEYRDATPGASAGGFEENEADVVMTWPITGKTSVDARIGHLERKHDRGSALDFSGVVGSASVAWDVTGKTRIVAGVARDLTATGLATGGHVRTHRAFVGPIWKATPQVAVNVRFDRVGRHWKDVPPGTRDVGRNESIRALSAGVDWEPRRWLTVSVYVRTERLKSSLDTGYRNTTTGAAVKAFF